jgi:hypothetical protein
MAALELRPFFNGKLTDVTLMRNPPESEIKIKNRKTVWIPIL